MPSQCPGVFLPDADRSVRGVTSNGRCGHMLLFEPPGVGKSHLIAASSHGLIDRGGWRVARAPAISLLRGRTGRRAPGRPGGRGSCQRKAGSAVLARVILEVS